MKEMKTEIDRIWIVGAGTGRLTMEGVDPSGDSLCNRIFHFPPPHTLDTQVLETVFIIYNISMKSRHYSNNRIILNKTHGATL